MVTQHTVNLGCDPEVFIRDSKGAIVDSEKVITGRFGLANNGTPYTTKPSSYCAVIVRDGVQAEFHPGFGSCTTTVNQNISAIILQFSKYLAKLGYHFDFTQTIDLSEDEFKALSPESRVLGCMPSLNIYEPFQTLGVDGGKYRKRSAGGHIHVGFCNNKKHPVWERRADLIPLLDILVGNTMVLIDRDPRAAERREVYGRAGEYRLPDHGLEYRTLSNFWLRSFPLMNFAFQMVRSAVQTGLSSMGIAEYDRTKFPATTIMKPAPVNFAANLLALVNLEDIRRAINTNDFDLAWSNFQKIKGWIAENWIESQENSAYPTGAFPLSKTKLDDFEFFIKDGMALKGVHPVITRWFGDNAVKWWTENWTSGTYTGLAVNPGTNYNDPAHSKGWNSFLTQVVRPARLTAEKALKFNQLIASGSLIKGINSAHLNSQGATI